MRSEMSGPTNALTSEDEGHYRFTWYNLRGCARIYHVAHVWMYHHHPDTSVCPVQLSIYVSAKKLSVVFSMKKYMLRTSTHALFNSSHILSAHIIHYHLK